ncbi:MAG: hypothetical protein AAFZ09_10180 [Pseudomonadota bacterium]
MEVVAPPVAAFGIGGKAFAAAHDVAAAAQEGELLAPVDHLVIADEPGEGEGGQAGDMRGRGTGEGCRIGILGRLVDGRGRCGLALLRHAVHGEKGGEEEAECGQGQGVLHEHAKSLPEGRRQITRPSVALH